MPSLRVEPIPNLFTVAGQVLGKSQGEIGELLGVSRRTVSRWVRSGSTFLLPSQADDLARAIHPVDPALAARIVGLRGETLESAGIVVPTPPVAPPPPPRYLVEVVVCAAAEALDVSPRGVRPALLAALERALEAGLSVEAMVSSLRPQVSKRPRR